MTVCNVSSQLCAGLLTVGQNEIVSIYSISTVLAGLTQDKLCYINCSC